jgi:hypothetical protein
MGRRILELVIPECRAGPAILFADLRVPYRIIHGFHIGFHDEILHQGLHILMPVRMIGAAHTEKGISVIFQKTVSGT